MANSKILVTGATGATGGSAVRELRAGGHEVRAFVHEDDERAKNLRALGAEVAIGNLLDIDSVRAALEDVRSAYFVYPLFPQLLDATVNFAQAAKEVGVSAIINTSQMTSRRDSKSHAAQSHWLAEQVFSWGDVPVTHLRPTLFLEWLLYPFSWESYAQRDTLALPLGNGKFAPISSEDQGRVIAAILLRVTLGLTKNILEAEKVYALACFNVLAHNRDDHVKNFSFLLNASDEWIFAPAYDLVFSYGHGGEQSMLVMGEGKNPGMRDLQDLGKKHALKNAPDILSRVRTAVTSWSRYAQESSVSAKSTKDIRSKIKTG
jgi:uncharacterized protein YbjT (DUF2867 family)